MKKPFLIVTFVILTAINIFATCLEPIIAEFDKPLITKEFIVKTNWQDKTIFLDFEAFAKDTSWGKKDSESAVLTIFLDGKYHQDIFLFKGQEKFNYKILLGKLALGKHKLTVFLNHKLSAKKIGKVKINKLNIKAIESNILEDKLAIDNAPFFYARPDTIGKFSDIPLLFYYEILPKTGKTQKIRYTVIYTNEDGGTQTTALMARWGRTTDIEWVYEIELEDEKIISAIFQGANHVTKNFKGKRIYGNHPVIYNVTVNNNFSDEGCSISRTAPIPIKADLSTKSRETLMDENAWAYQIMAQEIIREGRINPNNLGANTISDLQDYLFAEVKSELINSSISIEVKGIDGKIYQSDFGKPLLRISRSGYVRIALLVPKEVQNSITNVSVVCHPINDKDGACNEVKLLKVLRLNDKYLPQVFTVTGESTHLKTSESAEFPVKLK